MTKQKKTSGSKTKSEKKTFLNSFSFDRVVPSKYQLPLIIALVLIVFMLFFSSLYFGGKTYESGDIITSKSMETYLAVHEGGYTLWNPYIFCGMPAYALATGFKWFNVIWVGLNTLRSVFAAPFAVDYAKWTFYLLVLCFTMFTFMKNRTRNNLISLFSAFAVTFSTGIIVFLYIGHVTKLTTLSVYPLIFLMLFNLQKQIKLLDFLLLIVILNLAFLGWHVQIIFYLLFAIAIYFLYFLLRSIKLRDKILTTQLLKSAGVFIAAGIIALLIQADNLTQIYEYSPYSTRGTTSILDQQGGTKTHSETDFYQYATNWSFSPGEVLTFIVPSYYGFGKSTYQGPLSDNKPVEVNTYFGQMPFVDVAQYMGAVIFFLAIFSMIVNWKDPFVRYLVILSIISLLISFGRTFPILYDLMYNYFPFFDKFRVPSMILVLVQLSFPVLAGLGISKIILLKNETDKKHIALVKNLMLVFLGLFIFSLLFSSPIKAWFVERVSAAGQKAEQLKPLFGYMSDMFLNDMRAAFFLSAAAFALSFAYLKSKISADILIIALIIFVLFDLFRIDKRGETLTDYNQILQLFEKPDYVSVIEKQNDSEPFRILNYKQDGTPGSIRQNSNYNAYFLLQDLYGYSGIKPRAYQDLMDVIGSPANPTLWRMLNVKYFIIDRPLNYAGMKLIFSNEKDFIYRNENSLPRAYFVDTVITLPAMDILNNIKNNSFDPKSIAYLEEESIRVDKPDSSAYAKIISYKDEKINIEALATGKNFLFLGDTFFPKGWKAYIDGNETKIIKANHGFRGIVVPEGKHSIEFVYLPESFVISKYIALFLSSLILIGIIILLFMEKKKDKLTPQTT